MRFHCALWLSLLSFSVGFTQENLDNQKQSSKFVDLDPVTASVTDPSDRFVYLTHDDAPLARTPKLMLQLGMTLRQVTDSVMYDHLPLDVNSGVVVDNLLARLPANAAGIQWHDLIVKVDSKDVLSTDDFIHAFEYCKTDKVPMQIIHKGKHKSIVIEKSAVEEAKQYRIGIFVDAVPPALAKHLKLEFDVGLYVNKLVEKGPAEQAGIQPGDVLLSIDKKPINSVGELNAAIQNARDEPIVIELLHEGERRHAIVNPREDMNALREARANLVSPEFFLRVLSNPTEPQATNEQLKQINQSISQMRDELAELRASLIK